MTQRYLLGLFSLLALVVSACTAKVDGINQDSSSNQNIIKVGNGTGYEGIQDITKKLLAIDDNAVGSEYTCQDKEGTFALAIIKPNATTAYPHGRMYRRTSDDQFELLADTKMNRTENALQPAIIHYESYGMPRGRLDHWNMTISGNEAPVGKYFIPSTIQYDHLGAPLYDSNGDTPFYCRPTGESILDEVLLYSRDVPTAKEPHAQDTIIRLRGLEAESIYRRLSGFLEEATVAPVLYGKNVVCSRIAYVTQPGTNPFLGSYNCAIYVQHTGSLLDLSAADASTKKLVENLSTFTGDVWAEELKETSKFQNGGPGSLFKAGIKFFGGGSQEVTPMNLESDGIFRVKWDGWDSTLIYRFIEPMYKLTPSPVTINQVEVNSMLSYREATFNSKGLRCFSQLKVLSFDANNKPVYDNVDRSLQNCELSFEMNGAAADGVSLMPGN